VAALAGEDARADELCAEAAALGRRTGLRRGTAHVANEMGLAARARGQPERALALHREALAIHRAQLPTRAARTLGQLGCTEARLGQLEAAEAHLREAASLALATPSRPRRPWCWSGWPGWPPGGATTSGPPAARGGRRRRPRPRPRRGAAGRARLSAAAQPGGSDSGRRPAKPVSGQCHHSTAGSPWTQHRRY
jgi:hypothetical protein